MYTRPALPDPLDARSLAAAVRALAARDARLAAVVERHGPPPLWARRGGFRTLARMILEQQVSLASAATLFRRLDRELDGGIRAATVAAEGERGLRARGLTRQKAAYFVALARAVEDRDLRFGELHRLSDAAARAALEEVRGIGPWTSGIYLLMVLRRPDVWPPGDLALHVALSRLRGQNRVPSSAEAARYAERWRPWRSVAARILWHDYLSERPARGAGGE